MRGQQEDRFFRWATSRRAAEVRFFGLRNLAMIENIRRAHDPAWRERLEQQQLLARLGRMFGRAEDPLQALQDHADALKAELHTSRNGSRSRVAETARANDAGAGRIDRVANRPDRGSCEDDA